jgi:hypothetical protein
VPKVSHMVTPPRQVELSFTQLVDGLGGPDHAARALRAQRRDIDTWERDGPPWHIAALAWYLQPNTPDLMAHDVRYRLSLKIIECDALRLERNQLQADVLRLAGHLERYLPLAANDRDLDGQLTDFGLQRNHIPLHMVDIRP